MSLLDAFTSKCLNVFFDSVFKKVPMVNVNKSIVHNKIVSHAGFMTAVALLQLSYSVISIV